MNLRVVRPGLLTTVQDLGRHGWQRYGVSIGGAMDALSLRIANSLVGNAESDAALEMTLLGPTLQFDRDVVIAICGRRWSPRVGEGVVPMNRPVWLPGGIELAMGSAHGGARAYLAIAGGIAVPPVMGSRSNYLQAKVGGFEGRTLQAGDELPSGALSPLSRRMAEVLIAGSAEEGVRTVAWYAGLSPSGGDDTLRVIRGSEFELLDDHSQNALKSAEFVVTTQADRMGYRLAGPDLSLRKPVEMISAAVCCGTIQLPPGGEPILLTADCATTGGYPKIAHVASVDLPLAGQLKPGDSFRLREISLVEAHNLYCRQETALRCLQTNLRLKFAM
jgi:antagonist of KipI